MARLTGIAWRFEYERSDELPPRAWIATVQGDRVHVRCGKSVRCEQAGFFSGTWAGPATLESVANAPTVFGSGIVRIGDRVVVITPGHVMEGVWFAELPARTMVANSLAALLTAADLDLDPNQRYPALVLPMSDLRWMPEDGQSGLLEHCSVQLPTRSVPVTLLVFENMTIDASGGSAVVRKPREAPFASFHEFRDRLVAATSSLITNSMGYEPVVSLSGGYDSTAVAAVVAGLGFQRAVSIRTARLFSGGEEATDDGRAVARALGLEIELFDRESYRGRTDFPEAEFLSGGMTGEDVPMSAFEEAATRGILFTGFWAGTLWPRSQGYPPRHTHPGDFSGSGITEFALRADFMHVPLATFGATAGDVSGHICCHADMERYTVGGDYDRPIPRRLAEEAGVPRSAFALKKRAASVMLQRDPARWFSPASLGALIEFAGREGAALNLRRRSPSRIGRAVIRFGRAARLDQLLEPLEERRRALVHFEPHLGSVVLRWAVDIVRPRYSSAQP